MRAAVDLDGNRYRRGSTNGFYANLCLAIRERDRQRNGGVSRVYRPSCSWAFIQFRLPSA